jgi:hypothetical protein
MVQAQDVPRLPPEVVGVFAPGIEITASEIIPASHTQPRIDYEARTVSIFDQRVREYVIFPFPDGISSIRFVTIRSDDSLIFMSTPHDSDLFSPEEYFVLDPHTGEFTKPDLYCGVIPPLTSEENTWVFYADPQVRRTSVCNSATGDSVALVPLNQGGRWIETSLDGEWIVWAVGNRETQSIEVYATERVTQTQNYLGAYDAPYHDRFDRWVSDHQGVIYATYGGQSYPSHLLGFDATQQESLHNTFTVWDYTYYPDPPQYHYVQTAYGVYQHVSGNMGYIACQISVYYPLDNQVITYDMADDCGDVFSIGGQKYVYLGFNDDGSSSLYGLDVQSGEVSEYLRGEIEQLTMSSSDGRYALVVTDESGTVDFAHHDPFWFDLRVFEEHSSAKYQVFDTLAQRFLYEFPLFPYKAVEWVDEDTLVIASDYDAIPWGEPFILEVVDFSNTGAERKEIANVARIWSEGHMVPDGQHLLIWTETQDGTRGISALNLETDQLTPLILNMNLPTGEIRLTDISSVGVTAVFGEFRYVLHFPQD